MSILAAWTRQTLRDLGAAPSRKLGQHFLVDQTVVDRIVAQAAPLPGETVLEIGGGLGVLTQALAARAERLIVFEVDRLFRPFLAQTFAPQPHIQVYGDVLTEWDTAIAPLDPAAPALIVGNLPYQITGPLLELITAHPPPGGWRQAVVMVQREVADRMWAEPGDTERGRLSVLIEFHCLPGTRFSVGPESFHPKPQVGSTVLQLRPRPVPLLATGEVPAFTALVAKGFHMRRKTVWNNLRAGFPEADPDRLKAYLEANGVPLEQRPQDLPLKAWLKAYWVVRELGLSLAAPEQIPPAP